jgi:transcription elongation factor Elf1
MTTTTNRFCPKCKHKLESEGTALGQDHETTIWEVCDSCGYTRATEVREVGK